MSTHTNSIAHLPNSSGSTPTFRLPDDRTAILKIYGFANDTAKRFREQFQHREPGKTAELKEQWRITPEIVSRLNLWVTQKGGTDVISYLTHRAINEVTALIQHGHTSAGHDARHTLYKDPVEFLILLKGRDPYLQLGLPVSILHDIGRATEAEIARATGEIVPPDTHAKLGLVALQKIIDSVPKNLLHGISNADWEFVKVICLDAILEHQSGHSRLSPIAQLVQSADRRWLVGPEFPIRSIPFCVSRIRAQFYPALSESLKTTLPLPDTTQDNSLLVHTLFFVCNLYPACDLSAQQRADAAKAVSGAFVYLAASQNERELLFHAEITEHEKNERYIGTPLRKLIPKTIYEQIKTLTQAFERTYDSSEYPSLEVVVFNTLHQTLSADLQLVATHDNPNETVWNRIAKQLASLTDEQRDRLKKAFVFCAQEIYKEDNESAHLIHSIDKDLELNAPQIIALQHVLELLHSAQKRPEMR